MEKREVKIGERYIGDGHPVYIIAEIGINHNGDIDIAKKLIDGAVFSGCDAVKFQKRTPELCVPKDQWEIERDTPWGRMTYIDYRHRMEFNEEQYGELADYAKQKGIHLFASCWDEEAVDFIEKFDPPLYKLASASITDLNLLKKHRELKKPLMMSSGMSTIEEVEKGVGTVSTEDLLLAHSTSTYPCKLDELNINMIRTLRDKYPGVPIGYSGHETGLAPSWAAVAIGASFVERHITLDRAMWGTDQAASVEVGGFMKLVSNIRDIEKALGDGVKKVYESELPIRKKLRRVQ